MIKPKLTKDVVGVFPGLIAIANRSPISDCMFYMPSVEAERATGPMQMTYFSSDKATTDSSGT